MIAAEIDQHLANLTAGETGDLVTSPMITAWGASRETLPTSDDARSYCGPKGFPP